MKDKKNIKIPVKKKATLIAEPLKYKILKEGPVDLTKKKAYEFLELETFQGERPIREGHVQFLYDEVASGRFLWHNVTIAAAVLDNITYRINGQHTCWMRVNVEGSEDLKEHIVTERLYKVNDSEQLRSLYSAFDRNAPRSIGHISTVVLMDTDAGRDIPPSSIRCGVSGFRLWWSGGSKFNRETMNMNEVLEIIKQNYPAIFSSVCQFVRVHWDDHFFVRRSPVVAALFATFDKNVKASMEFWEPVATGLSLENKSDPRFALRNFLIEHSLTLVKGNKKVGAETMYRICINAWNSWRKGESVTHFKPSAYTGDRPAPRS